MYFLNLLFSKQGKINRGEWWLGQLGAVAFIFIFGSLFHVTVPTHLSLEVLSTVFSLHNLTIGGVIFIGYLWIHLALNIKRFQDLNKHGAYAALCYIPILGFFISFIVLGLVPGDIDENS